MFSGTCAICLHVPFTAGGAGSPARRLQHTQQLHGGPRQTLQRVQQLQRRHFLRHEQNVVLSQPRRQGDASQAQFLQRTVGDEQAVLFKFHFVVHVNILLYF